MRSVLQALTHGSSRPTLVHAVRRGDAGAEEGWARLSGAGVNFRGGKWGVYGVTEDSVGVVSGVVRRLCENGMGEEDVEGVLMDVLERVGLQGGAVVVIGPGKLWSWGKGRDVRCILGRDGSCVELGDGGAGRSVVARQVGMGDLFVVIGTFRDGVYGVLSGIHMRVKRGELGLGLEEVDGEEACVLVSWGSVSERKAFAGEKKIGIRDFPTLKNGMLGDPLGPASDFGYRSMRPLLGAKNLEAGSKDAEARRPRPREEHDEDEDFIPTVSEIIPTKKDKVTSALGANARNYDLLNGPMGADMRKRDVYVGPEETRKSKKEDEEEGEGVKIRRRSSFLRRKGSFFGRAKRSVSRLRQEESPASEVADQTRKTSAENNRQRLPRGNTFIVRTVVQRDTVDEPTRTRLPRAATVFFAPRRAR